jgi:VanZ family protein
MTGMVHYLGSMIRPVLLLVSIGVIGALVVASVMPGNWRPHTPLRTTLEHFVAYGIAAAWFALILASRWARAGMCLILIGLAGAMELVQTVVPGRRPEWLDFYYGAAGAVAGTAAGWFLAFLGARAARLATGSSGR